MTKAIPSVKTVYDCAPLTIQDPKPRVRRQVDTLNVFGPNRPRTRFRFSDIPASQIGSTFTRRQGPGENAISVHRVISSSQTNEVSETVSETGSERSVKVMTSSGTGNVVGSEKRSRSKTSEVTENQTSSGGTSNIVLVNNGNSRRPNAILVNQQQRVVPVNVNSRRPDAILDNRQQNVPVTSNSLRPSAVLVNRQLNIGSTNSMRPNVILGNRQQMVVPMTRNIQTAPGNVNVNNRRQEIVPVNTNIQTTPGRRGFVYVNNAPQGQNVARAPTAPNNLLTARNVQRNTPNVDVMAAVNSGRQPTINSQVLDISVNAGKVNVQPGLRLTPSDQGRSGNVKVLDIRKAGDVMGVNSGLTEVPAAPDANLYTVANQQSNDRMSTRNMDPRAANVNVQSAVNMGDLTVNPQVLDLTVTAGEVNVNPALNLVPADQRRISGAQASNIQRSGTVTNINSVQDRGPPASNSNLNIISNRQAEAINRNRLAGPVGSFKNSNSILTSGAVPQGTSVASSPVVNVQPALEIPGVTRENPTITREMPSMSRESPAIVRGLPADTSSLKRPSNVYIQPETSVSAVVPTDLEIDVSIDKSNTVGGVISGGDIPITSSAAMIEDTKSMVVSGPAFNSVLETNKQISSLDIDGNVSLQPRIRSSNVNVESTKAGMLDLSNVVMGNTQRRNLDLSNVVVRQDNPVNLANTIRIQAGERDANLAMVRKDEPNLSGTINAVNVLQTEVQKGLSDASLAMVSKDDPNLPESINTVNILQTQIQTGLSDSNLIKEDIVSDTKTVDVDQSKLITILSAEQQAANIKPASVSAINVQETSRGAVNQISNIRPIGDPVVPTAGSRPFVTSWVSKTGFRNSSSSGVVKSEPAIGSQLTAMKENRSDNMNPVNARVHVKNASRVGTVNATVSSGVSKIVTTPIPLEWNVNGSYYDNSSYYGNYTGDRNYTGDGYYTADGNYTYYNGTMYPDYASIYGNETMYGNYSFYNETGYPGNEAEYYWNMTEPTVTNQTGPNGSRTVIPMDHGAKPLPVTNRTPVITLAPVPPTQTPTRPTVQMNNRKYANIDFKNLSPGKVPYLPDYRNNLDNFGGVAITGVKGTSANRIDDRRGDNAVRGEGTGTIVDKNESPFRGGNVAIARNTQAANLDNNLVPVMVPDPPVVGNVINRPKIVVSYPLDSNSVAIGQVRARNTATSNMSVHGDRAGVATIQGGGQEVDYYTLVNEIVDKLKLFTAKEGNADMSPMYDTDMNNVVVGMGRENMQRENQFGTPIRMPSSITGAGIITDIAPTLRDERRLETGRTQIDLEMPPIDVPTGRTKDAQAGIRQSMEQFQGFPYASGESQITDRKINMRPRTTAPSDMPPISISSNNQLESKRRGTGYDLVNMVNNNRVAKTTFDFFNKNTLDRDSNSKSSAANSMNGGISVTNRQMGDVNPIYDLNRSGKGEAAVKTIWENQGTLNGGDSMSYNGRFTYPGDVSNINFQDLPIFRTNATSTRIGDISRQTDTRKTAEIPTQGFQDLTSIQPATSQAGQSINQSDVMSSPTEITPEYIAFINRDIQIINDELISNIKQTNKPIANTETPMINPSDTVISNDAIPSTNINENVNNSPASLGTRNVLNVDAAIMASILNSTIKQDAQISQSLPQNTRIGSVLSNVQMEDVSLKILETLQTIVKELQLSRELAIARHNLLKNQSLTSTAGAANNVNGVLNGDVRGNSFDLAQNVPAIERKIGNVKTLAQNLDAIHQRLNGHIGMAESNPVWQVNPSLLSSGDIDNQRGALLGRNGDATAGFQTENMFSVKNKQPWGATGERTGVLSSMLGLMSNATTTSGNNMPLDTSLQNSFDVNSGNSNFLLNTIRDNRLRKDQTSLQTTNAIESSIADIYQSLFGAGKLNTPSSPLGEFNAPGATDQPVNMNELYLQNQLYDLTGVTEQQKQQIMDSLSNAYTDTGVSNPGNAAPFNSDPLVYVCPNGETFSCKPVGTYSGIPGMEWWCFNHCKNGPGSGSCPKSKCQCTCNPTNTEKAMGVGNMLIEPFVNPKQSLAKGTNSKPGDKENSVLRKKIFKKVITLTLNGSKENAVQVNDKGPEIMVSRAPNIITDTNAPDMTYIALGNGGRRADRKPTNIGAVAETLKSIRKSQLNVIDNRLVCRGKGKFENIEGIVDWCTTMCRQAMCPGFVCTCWS